MGTQYSSLAGRTQLVAVSNSGAGNRVMVGP